MIDSKNMRLWDQLKTTDPRHTKSVEFGRRFTSIDAHWQIQRMTEIFGPVGEGWKYHVDHSVVDLSYAQPNLVLAVADVMIVWRAGDNEGCEYGPIRGTAPLIENDKSGKPRLDDDAPKKAMTDALTKGLSHLGVSADVFLGMYDDNKYVQRLKREFANGNGATPPQQPTAIDAVDPADRDLVNGDGRSTYQIKTADKSSGRLAAELWASNNLLLFTGHGYDLLQYKEWKVTPCTNKGTKTNEQKLAELREKHPDLAQKLDDAIDKLSLARAQ